MKELDDNFSFFVDKITLEKAGKDNQGKDIMKVGGIATTRAKDSDGEEIDEKGWDVDYFVNNGFFNYNHQSKFNPSAVIGEPTTAKVTKDGVYVEGYLYADSELAKSVYETTKMLENSSSSRRMGFSIEGKALARDPFNEKKITKARLTGCALTLNPKNPNTLVNLLKGEMHNDPLDYSYTEATEVVADIEKSEDYIVCLEKDGKCIKIDKELNITINDTGSKEIQKSLSTVTGAPVMVESMDQDVKSSERLPSDKKYLTKGEVYSEIFNYIKDCDLDTADLMFKHINVTATKRIQMEKGNNDGSGISRDDIQKSLDIVLASTEVSENDLNKSSYKGEESEDDDMEKMSEKDMKAKMEKAMAEDEDYQKLKKGYDMADKAMVDYREKIEKGEVSGYPSTASAKAETMIDDENAASIGKEGEFIKKSEETETFSKADVEDLIKGVEDTMSAAITVGLGEATDLVKSLAQATEGLLGLNGDLQKSLDVEVERNDDLKKGLDDTIERLERVEATPIPSRTVTSQNYQSHPTLEKSMDGGKTLHVTGNKAEILDILDKKSGLDEGGTPNMAYAQAMSTFEGSGILEKGIADDLMKSEGITILGL